jgi:glycosyltransferase involved in cell wall biosynthesis
MLPSRDTRIVIPCYNEAARLRVNEFLAHVRRDPRVGLIFVNDGSTDGTLSVLRTLAKRSPESIEVLSLPRNAGKAEAVRMGMRHALASGAPYCGYWDADLATPLSAIDDLRAALHGRPHVVCVLGSRVKLLGRTIERRAVRHYLGRVFATAVSLLTGLAIYDSQCGAKLFRRCSHVDAMFAHPFATRWLFDVELLMRLRVQVGTTEAVEHALAEYPLHEWVDVGGSKLTLIQMLRAPIALAQIFRIYGAGRSRERGRPPVAVGVRRAG